MNKIKTKLEFEDDPMGENRLMEIFTILLTEYEKKNERNSGDRNNFLPHSSD